MLTRREFVAGTLATAGVFCGLTGAAVAREKRPGWARLVNMGIPMRPGEIHVVPEDFALYLSLRDNKAVRYPAAVGRENLYFPGVFYIGEKREWPGWTPTRNMIRREPEVYGPLAGGVPGGPLSPLGARALYLYRRNGRDSLLRIHGTHEDNSIGFPVSNGCVRLSNGYIVHLYNRVALRAKVTLHPRPA